MPECQTCGHHTVINPCPECGDSIRFPEPEVLVEGRWQRLVPPASTEISKQDGVN